MLRLLRRGMLILMFGVFSLMWSAEYSARAQSRSATASPLPFNAFSPEEISTYVQVQRARRFQDYESYKAMVDRGGLDALDRAIVSLWSSLRIPDPWKGRCNSCSATIEWLDFNNDPFPD